MEKHMFFEIKGQEGPGPRGVYEKNKEKDAGDPP